jgi:hypothetical protein
LHPIILYLTLTDAEETDRTGRPSAREPYV